MSVILFKEVLIALNFFYVNRMIHISDNFLIFLIHEHNISFR